MSVNRNVFVCRSNHGPFKAFVEGRHQECTGLGSHTLRRLLGLDHIDAIEIADIDSSVEIGFFLAY